MNLHKILFLIIVVFGCVVYAEPGAGRFAGKWQGKWLEGMGSGKVYLDLAAEGDGKIEMTRFPKFGEGKAPVREVVAEGDTLKFVTARADGEKVSFDLKLNEAGSKLKGKARYEGSRVEVELERAEEQ